MIQLKRLVNLTLTYLVFGLILFYIIFPIYWIVLSSFRSPNTIFQVSYLPTNLTTVNYRLLPLTEEFVIGLQNSTFVAAIVLLLTLTFGSAAAYALGRLNFRGQGLIRYAVLAMVAFPQIAIVGGLYLLITNPCVVFGGSCPQFEIYNTRWALIISYLVLTLPLTIWFLAAYYKSLPEELEEAAFVDGASPLQAFYKILLPLSAPGLVTTGLLSFIIAWNEFIFAITFTIDSSSRTAPVMITQLSTLGSLTNLAAAVIVTVPVVTLAIAFRHQLTAGLTGFVRQASAGDSWLQQQVTRLNLPSLMLNVPAKILLFLLGLLLLSFIHYGWNVITFPYTVDYGEGPLLGQTMRLAAFENIYLTDLTQPPYTVTNYPPLFMLIQVPLAWLFGPAFWYGRLLSWASIIAAAIFVALILHALTRDRLAAIIGGLLLIGMPYVAYWSALNRIDSLALCLSLAGLWVIVRWADRRWGLLVGAVLLTAAVYTRQSYGLAAPLAAFVWLLSYAPRYRAVTLLTWIGGLGLGLFGLLNLLSDGGFFFSIITANINEYRADILATFLEEMWIFMPYLVIAGSIYLLIGWRSKAWSLLAPYLVGAVLSGLTIGKIGSNVNYLLEFSAAVSLIMGAFIAWFRPRAWLHNGFILLLAMQVYFLLPGLRYQLFVESLVAQPREMGELMAIVQTSEGPVIADQFMGLIPLAGQPLYAQPFELTQLSRDGLWDQRPLLKAMERKEIATIIVWRVSTDLGPLEENNWSPEMLAHIDRYYEQTALINRNIFVYEPRE